MFGVVGLETVLSLTPSILVTLGGVGIDIEVGEGLINEYEHSLVERVTPFERGEGLWVLWYIRMLDDGHVKRGDRLVSGLEACLDLLMARGEGETATLALSGQFEFVAVSGDHGASGWSRVATKSWSSP